MIVATATLFAVFCLLLIAEKLRHEKIIHGEIARKFVHITVGAFIATWPYYLDMLTIQVLCLVLLAGVVASRYFTVFKAIHEVRRKTWGDLLFPLGVGLSATLAAEPWVFTAAVLHLSVADGVAALIGERYINAGKYKILGQTKSVVGSLAFWLVSFMIVSLLLITHSKELSLVAMPLLLGLTTATTLVENVAPSGTDNILVPFVVVSVLNSLIFFG